jgi:hypothetical protein
MRDMMKVAMIAPEKPPPGGGVKVPTNVHGGGWRGRVYMVCEDDGSERRIVAVRTWPPE